VEKMQSALSGLDKPGTEVGQRLAEPDKVGTGKGHDSRRRA
jgi:hypothetical protein